LVLSTNALKIRGDTTPVGRTQTNRSGRLTVL
jgi:hypothetical protein